MQFGFDKGKKKKEERDFDLEKDLKNPASLREMKERLNTRVQDLKTALRKGEDKKDFDETQTVLHGYLAAQKVIQRVGR